MFNFIVFLLAAFVMLFYISFRVIDWLLTVWWWLPFRWEWVEVTTDAVQEPSAGGILQHASQAAQEGGRECERVEQGQQGVAAAQAREEAQQEAVR